jgi:hypothetical protein
LRQAHYNYFTGLAYKLNNDIDRMSALRIRNIFMKDTLTKENVIPSDRVPKPKSMGSFLPAAVTPQKDDSES